MDQTSKGSESRTFNLQPGDVAILTMRIPDGRVFVLPVVYHGRIDEGCVVSSYYTADLPRHVVSPSELAPTTKLIF